MYAQKPHRGCLHNTHIRPEGEAFCVLPFVIITRKKASLVMPFFTQFARKRLGGRVNAGEVKWKAPKIRPQRENEP